MKIVDWKDELGRYFKMALPDEAPLDSAQFGTVIGPPCLDEALPGLPFEQMVRLHNNLHAMGILTAHDAKTRRADVQAALQRTYAVDTSRVVEAFGQVEEVVQVPGIVVPALNYSDFTPRETLPPLAGATATRRRQRRRN